MLFHNILYSRGTMKKTICDICGEEIVDYRDGWLHTKLYKRGIWHMGAGDDFIPDEMDVHQRCWAKSQKGRVMTKDEAILRLLEECYSIKEERAMDRSEIY